MGSIYKPEKHGNICNFKTDAKCGLRGHLEAAMASEATKKAIRGNLYMEPRVIVVANFKS